MPRKYSGPLQPGKRSAYVKGTNARKKRRYVKKVGLNKVEKAQVKDIVKDKKEPLYCERWYRYDDAPDYADFLQKPLIGSTPILPIYNGTYQSASALILQAGEYLNQTSVDVNAQYANTVYPMGGLGMDRGTDANDIVGNYAYMNSRKVNLQINAVPFFDNGNASNKFYRPLQFRVLHITMKPSRLNLPNMLTALFIDQMGKRIGLQTVGSVKDLMYDWEINKDQFTVHKDFRITLQQTPVSPVAPTSFQQSTPLLGQVFDQGPRHPSQHNFSFWLERPKKKLRFAVNDNGINNAFEPVNANLQDYVIVFCTRYETCGNPDAMNGVGPQTADQWQVRMSGVTKFRES